MGTRETRDECSPGSHRETYAGSGVCYLCGAKMPLVLDTSREYVVVDVPEPVQMLHGEDAEIFEQTTGLAPLACSECGAIGRHTRTCSANAKPVTAEESTPMQRRLAHERERALRTLDEIRRAADYLTGELAGSVPDLDAYGLVTLTGRLQRHLAVIESLDFFVKQEGGSK